MAKSPMRFKRIMAKFDDDARARLCQSSGSEHSSNNSITDLSDLVDSFFEAGCCDHRGGEKMDQNDFVDEIRDEQEVSGYNCTDLEDKEMLADLFEGGSDIDGNDDVRTKRAICCEVESLCSNLDDCSSEGFKRSLMSSLRQRGYDAGLCKSRWAKTGRHPAGEYEYIDILISKNTRYIIEVSLDSEFTIARPTKTYQTLLETIPKITVIKPNNLKKVVRLMCAAMRTSLKTKDMAISPWRKNGYMQSKWFGSYKRTTNANAQPSMLTSPATAVSIDSQSLLGFEYSPAVKSYCRKQVERMHVVGNLKTLMLSGMS